MKSRLRSVGATGSDESTLSGMRWRIGRRGIVDESIWFG